MRTRILPAGLWAISLVIAGSFAQTSNEMLPQGGGAKAHPQTNTAGGNEDCASCHSEIYKSYGNTAMAKASGLAADGVVSGGFDDKDSGVRYRVYEQDGRVWMSYEREGKGGTRGQRELLYFIGSGEKGRTFLFSDDGFWFEAPINWYSQEHRWNMTPAYTGAQEIPMNLPAYPSCLTCHTSRMQAPIAGTENKFLGKPFLHAGITCERCHGADIEHAGAKGTGAFVSGALSSIVNPAKLPAQQRDGICMECHFEGTVAVEQPGRHLYEFQPGERLSDYVHYFLMTENTEQQKPRALSQFEALSLSACKKKSGDKMWCGSCHDPHADPAEAERATYYRAKCLACHGEEFAAKHHADKQDCVGCHMPELPSKDVAHTETTDHRILRYPNQAPLPQLQIRGQRLKSFPPGDDSLTTTRDLALAWETLAERGVDGAEHEAEQYLQKAVRERPADARLLAVLGLVEQRHFHENDARELYERALKMDPLLVDAATNLGVLDARGGNLPRAVKLWQGAFARAPYRSAIGMNLAMVFCAAGQKDVAKNFVERVLEFNPDYAKGKSLQRHLAEENGPCRP